MSLPRTEEHLIRDHVKFRVGKIVYASISPDETTLGFGFPKEERAALIDSQPDRFLWPKLSDQRFQWIVARMAALDPARCASSSSTPGAWSCRRKSRRLTSAS